MPSSVSKVQRNDEIAKQHVLQEWNLPFLLNQRCFSQSFGLCWLQLPVSCRYRIRRDQQLRAVGGGSRRSSKPRLLLAAIHSSSFPVGICNPEPFCSSSSLSGTGGQLLDGENKHPCLLAAQSPLEVNKQWGPCPSCWF